MSNVSIQGLDLTFTGLTEKLTAFKVKHCVEDCICHDWTCNLLLKALNVVYSMSKMLSWNI
jgi:hypothetical protein